MARRVHKKTISLIWQMPLTQIKVQQPIFSPAPPSLGLIPSPHTLPGVTQPTQHCQCQCPQSPAGRADTVLLSGVLPVLKTQGKNHTTRVNFSCASHTPNSLPCPTGGASMGWGGSAGMELLAPSSPLTMAELSSHRPLVSSTWTPAAAAS